MNVISVEAWDAVGSLINLIMLVGKVGTVYSLARARSLSGVNGWSCYVFLFTCAVGVLKSADFGLWYTALTMLPMLVGESLNCYFITKKRTNHWFRINHPRINQSQSSENS